MKTKQNGMKTCCNSQISIYFNELKIFAVFLFLSLSPILCLHVMVMVTTVNQPVVYRFFHSLPFSLSLSMDIQNTCKILTHLQPTYRITQTPLSPYGFKHFSQTLSISIILPRFFITLSHSRSCSHSLCVLLLLFFGKSMIFIHFV